MPRTSPISHDDTTLDPLLTGRVIEVRWSASIQAPRRTRRPGRHPVIQELALVVTLRPVTADSAVLEAWLETPAGLRNVVPRQQVPGRITVTDGWLHLDAELDGRRAIALSMPVHPGPDVRTMTYAQSTLLVRAGLAPGMCNPPTAHLQRREADAVPA